MKNQNNKLKEEMENMMPNSIERMKEKKKDNRELITKLNAAA